MTVAGKVSSFRLPDAARARLRRAVRGTGAAVTGLIAVAVLAGLAALGGGWARAWTGAEATADAAASRQVAITPAESMLVCPPPVELPKGADVGDDQFEAAPVATVSRVGVAVVGSTQDEPRTTALDGSGAKELTRGSAAAVSQADVTTPRVLHATPEASEPFRAAGALASVTTTGDLRGLAVGRCADPSTSHWLVGGSTEVGASALLTVQNPGPRPATISLEAFGPAGPVALGGSASFVVGPQAARVVRLESVAPEQRRLVVHVEAAGARVVASLQVHAIEGLVPTGVDRVSAGTEPTTSFAVAGVVSAGEAVDDVHAPRLRLLAAGEKSGTARVSVYGPSGPVTLRGAQDVALEPGVVTDVPLGGLPSGRYTVAVDSDVPVVGAGRFDRQGEAPEDAVVDASPYDVAWVPAQAVAGPATATQGMSSGLVALPSGVRSAVTASALPADRGPDVDPVGTTTVLVRALAADGRELGSTETELGAGTAVSLDPGALGDGEQPAAISVDVVGGDPLSVVWSAFVVAEDGTERPGALIAALAPTTATTAPDAVHVRRVDAGG